MNNKLKKIISIGICLAMLSCAMPSFADETTDNNIGEETRPEFPNGEVPPEMPNGETPPEMPNGERPERREFKRIEFSDVASDAWYFEYVNFVAMRGIMTGKDGEFKPSEQTTRGEYVHALYNGAGAPECEYDGSFSDVSADSEFAKAVAWAVQNGITSGVGDGLFEPNSPLTREMAMTFLYRALDTLKITKAEAETDLLGNFTDSASVSDWAKDAMNTLVNMSVINGTDEGALNPQGSLVNCEVATMLYKALGGDKRPNGFGENAGKEPPENSEGVERKGPPEKPEDFSGSVEPPEQSGE